MSAGRLGYQPARDELFKRGISVTEAARDLGIPGRHLEYAVRGKAHPMDIVRQRLPEYLRMPLHKLFTEESLSKRYSEHHNKWRKASK
jgi:hypothetical protein